MYTASNRVREDVERTAAEPVPLHLRNPVTGLMSHIGYGKGYEHAHHFEDAVPGMECLPEALRGRRYYFPTERGAEKRIAERMQEVEEKKAELRKQKAGNAGVTTDE